VEALHHPPRLAITPGGGPMYVSWSSEKPKPEGTLFASDLRLSRSLDGGRTFEAPLRVNEDRPISHSFDGLAVAADGTVLVTWIDGHEGRPDPATWLARVVDGGTRVESIRKVGDDTCVCCRVDAAVGPADSVALAWRRVFPGDIRDKITGKRARFSRAEMHRINYPDMRPYTAEELRARPDVFHPLVRRHDRSGRISLYIGRWACDIEGMPPEEGRALVAWLQEFARQDRFVYRHRWCDGDAVLWDNRCTQHCATPFDEARYTRLMHRTTLEGDAPIMA
jgi:hypothetical protein